MTGNLLTLAATILGGLIVTGLVSWIRTPRLVVLMPRMFSYSALTERGQLVELTVFNRGFKTEEDVDVTLNTALRYELIGSNSQYATITQNKIQISRVAPSDDVTVLLLVENGSFEFGDIIQCLSNQTQGKRVTKLEMVPPTGQQRVALVGMVIAIPIFFWGVTAGIDLLYKPSLASASAESEKLASAAPSTLDINGWIVPEMYKRVSPELFKGFSDGKISATVGNIVRQADIVSVHVLIQNETDLVLDVTLSMNTPDSSKRLKSYELSARDILIFPGRSEERTLKVVVPEHASDRLDRTVFMEIFIQSDGESLKLARRHLLPQLQ